MGRTKPQGVLPGGIYIPHGSNDVESARDMIDAYGVIIRERLDKHEGNIDTSSCRSASEAENFRQYCAAFKQQVEEIFKADKRPERLRRWVKEVAMDFAVWEQQLREMDTGKWLMTRWQKNKEWEEWKGVNDPVDPKAIAAKRARDKKAAEARVVAGEKQMAKEEKQERERKALADKQFRERVFGISDEEWAATAAGGATTGRSSRKRTAPEKIKEQGPAVGRRVAQKTTSNIARNEQQPEESRERALKTTKEAEIAAIAAGKVVLGPRQRRAAEIIEDEDSARECEIAPPRDETRKTLPKPLKQQEQQQPQDSLEDTSWKTKEDEMAAIASGKVDLGSRKRRAPEKLDDGAMADEDKVVPPPQKRQRTMPAAPKKMQKKPAPRKQQAQNEEDSWEDAAASTGPSASTRTDSGLTSSGFASTPSAPTSTTSATAPPAWTPTASETTEASATVQPADPAVQPAASVTTDKKIRLV